MCDGPREIVVYVLLVESESLKYRKRFTNRAAAEAARRVIAGVHEKGIDLEPRTSVEDLTFKVTCPRYTTGFQSTRQRFEPPAAAGQVDRLVRPDYHQYHQDDFCP